MVWCGSKVRGPYICPQGPFFDHVRTAESRPPLDMDISKAVEEIFEK